MFLKSLTSSKTTDISEKTMNPLHPWRRLLYVNNDMSFPVILGKGGQLIATIAFAGHDLRTSPDHELFVSSNQRIHILSSYANEEGFVFHDDLTTAPSEYGRAPWFMDRQDVEVVTNDEAVPVVNLLANERKERHSGLVEPVIFETITYQPPKKTLKKLKKLIYGADDVAKSLEQIDLALEEFNHHVINLVEKLSSLGRTKRLNADQLYSYCYYTLTGVWTQLKAPKENGTPFDKLLNIKREDDSRGNAFSVKLMDGQRVYIRVVTPYGMPEQIRPEFFEGMAFMGPGIRWSTRLALTPAEKVRKEYTHQWQRWLESTQKWRQRWKQEAGQASLHDPVQRRMAIQAEEDVQATKGAAFGAYLTSAVIIYRTSAADADKEAKNVASYLLGLGKPCEIEEHGTKIAMAATLPGNPKYQGSVDLLNDYPAVTSLPCSLPYTGPDVRGGIGRLRQSVAWQFTIKGMFPARVDFGNGQNRHIAITAPIRTGKSTLLQLIIQMLLSNTKSPFIYLLDVDVEKSASNIGCKALGGKVLSFGKGTAAIQPFRDIENVDRREASVRWVKQCIRAHGLDDKKPAIQRRIEEAFDLMTHINKEHRTVELFQVLVQDRDVKQCMTPFATGEYAAHVGGNQNVIGEPPYVVIDCTGLNKGEPKTACVMAALVDEITFTVGHHNGPVLLAIDEAVQVFPLIGETIDAAYKRWPKQGGGIAIVIHDPRDLDTIGNTGKIIIQNTGAWVCLADKGAIDNRAYESNIRLTEFQRALLGEMRQGDFMLKIEGEVRVLQTDLSSLEKWVLGQTGKDATELALRISEKTSTSDEFGIELLKEGGFYEEAKRIEGGNGGSAMQFGIAAE